MLPCNPVPNMFCLLCLALQDIWWHYNDLSRLVRKVLLAFQWFIACSSWLPSHLSTFYFALYKPVSCITDVHEHESLNKYSVLLLVDFLPSVLRLQSKFIWAFVGTLTTPLTGRKHRCYTTHLAKTTWEMAWSSNCALGYCSYMVIHVDI